MDASQVFDHDESIPRDVIAIGHDYPASFELDRHHHLRNQLLYAEKGVVAVSTSQGAWTAPPERAVWIPAGVPHSVRMVGQVSTRSVLIAAEVSPDFGDRCRVVAVELERRRIVVADGQHRAGDALVVVEDLAGVDGGHRSLQSKTPSCSR